MTPPRETLLTIDNYEWYYEPDKDPYLPWRWVGWRHSGRTENVFSNRPLTAADHRAIADILDPPKEAP